MSSEAGPRVYSLKGVSGAVGHRPVTVDVVWRGDHFRFVLTGEIVLEGDPREFGEPGTAEASMMILLGPPSRGWSVWVDHKVWEEVKADAKV